MAEPARVLIIRPGALGDAVLTEPVVASVRAAQPDAHIELAGRTEFLPLLVGPGRADACRSMDDAAFTSLFTDGPAELPGYDAILAYLPDADGALAAKLSACCARTVVFDPRPPDDATVHIVDHLLAALGPFGIEPARTDPVVEVRPEWAAVPGLPGEYAVVHPGSGGAAKRWPAEKWAAVIRALRPLPAVLTCGPADEETVAGVLERLDAAVGVVRDQPVTTIARVVGGAGVYFGVDSGVTHLAAALGVPTVAVFGPTDPAIWAPRGRHVRVVAGPQKTTASVSVDSPLAASADLDADDV